MVTPRIAPIGIPEICGRAEKFPILPCPCRANYLRPFLSIVNDAPTEVSGRACKYLGAQISEAGVELGISQPGIDRTVELVDDVCGRVFGAPISCQPMPS